MLPDRTITYRLMGEFALFSDPITRVGGEKASYAVPTYQALKGITESVYWKPTLQWRIDRVKVMKPIQTHSKGIRPVHYNDGKNDLSIYSYLWKVEYLVQAHFDWNLNRPDLEQDRNERKHIEMARRMLERGGRRDIFLGTRECQGYVEPCSPSAFEEEPGAYAGLPELNLGLMFHGFDYPDETGKNQLAIRLWIPVMKRGIIDFLSPEACTDIRIIKEQSQKKFILYRNILPVEQEVEL